MAECGVASRRRAEEMIAAGQVTVNGQLVTQMGTQVEEGDEVRVDGKVIHPETEKRYPWAVWITTAKACFCSPTTGP